ncbi:hypothetical protein CDD83_2419 [Cordyceps sp. RAO-2017]|nr:hypothetical protein CDD83_2419 [Cordyceps sp. RAO-2017]
MAWLRLSVSVLALTRLTDANQGQDIAPSSDEPQDRLVKVALPEGFSHRLFYDDFSSEEPGSLPSRQRWKLDLGIAYPDGPEHWGTGEVQIYTDNRSNIAITNEGTLKITPIRLDNGTWTSARIETTPEGDFACQAGQRVRVQARIKLGDDPEERQMGIWPCFWALGSAIRERLRDALQLGEIDIMETINGRSELWHVVHCGTGPRGPCNEYDGLNHAVAGVARGQWHTVAWEIDRRSGSPRAEESMRWYVDGRLSWTLLESQIQDESAWTALVGNSRILLLNVAVGGGFPNGVSGIKTPTNMTLGGDGASMEVDYVAVFASEADGGGSHVIWN